jgi:hypothetical protein
MTASFNFVGLDHVLKFIKSLIFSILDVISVVVCDVWCVVDRLRNISENIFFVLILFKSIDVHIYCKMKPRLLLFLDNHNIIIILNIDRQQKK